MPPGGHNKHHATGHSLLCINLTTYRTYVDATSKSQLVGEDDREPDHFLPDITQPDQQLAQSVPVTTGDDDGAKGSNFSWEKPLPPAPHGGRESQKHMHMGHQHYCEYSRLMHKGMHNYTSVSSGFFFLCFN